MKMKVGIIGVPSNIHLQRRVAKIDKSQFDIIIISPIHFNLPSYRGTTVFSLSVNHYSYLRHFRLFYHYYLFIKNQCFDIIYCFGALCPLSWLAGIACKRHLVVTTIGVDVFLEDQIKITSIIKRNTKNLLQIADRITVLSQAMAKRLHKAFGLSEKKIIEDFLDIEDIWYTQPTKHSAQKFFPIIFSPRMLQPLYQQMEIIKALPLIKEKFPTVLFIQTSFGKQLQYYNRCRDLIESLNLAENVKFLDEFDSHSDLIPFFDLSNLIIMIPKSDGMPASMIEAWARKKPVIVSNIDNYYENWNRKFFLKTNIDPISLTKAVFEILEKDVLRDSIVSNATHFLEEKQILFRKLNIFHNLPTKGKKEIFAKLKNFFWFLLFLCEPWFTPRN